MLRIRRVKVQGRQLDDEQLKELSLTWIGLLDQEPSYGLVFVLPSVLITASFNAEVKFRETAKKELRKWHRCLDSGLGGGGNKRRWLKNLSPTEYRILCTGLFARNGKRQ